MVATNCTVLSSSNDSHMKCFYDNFKPNYSLNFLGNLSFVNFDYTVFVTKENGDVILDNDFAELILCGAQTCTVLLGCDDGHKVLARARIHLNHELGTAVSVRFSIEQAAIDLIIDYFSIPCNHIALPRVISGSRVNHVEIEGKDDLDRRIRAAHFPPVSLPTFSHEDRRGFLVDSENDCMRIVNKVNSDCQGGNGQKEGRAFESDTHFFYSNVGGSIVRISESSSLKNKDDLSDIHRIASHAVVIPGASVDGKRKKLRMNEPLIGRNALLYVERVLSSGWIGVEGPFIKKLQKRFAEICGCSDGGAVAVQSGTAALYGALKAVGISRVDDVVLCPSFTCAACADAVVHTGGTPFIVDVLHGNFSISIDSIKEAIRVVKNENGNRSVKAVVVAPCYGVPATELQEIVEFCRDERIFVIEDNCETYGALVNKIPVGCFGDISVVSIRSEKMVGVGEGGLVISRNRDLLREAKWWCSRSPSRGCGLWKVYEHDEVGQNFRLPELLAAVGCAALENLPVMISRKRQLHAWYMDYLPHDWFQVSCDGSEPVWWVNAIILPRDLKGQAEKIGMSLIEKFPEIEVRPGFYPLNHMKPFRENALECPISEDLYSRLVCLPSSPHLNKNDVEHICRCFIETVQEARFACMGA